MGSARPLRQYRSVDQQISTITQEGEREVEACPFAGIIQIKFNGNFSERVMPKQSSNTRHAHTYDLRWSTLLSSTIRINPCDTTKTSYHSHSNHVVLRTISHPKNECQNSQLEKWEANSQFRNLEEQERSSQHHEPLLQCPETRWDYYIRLLPYISQLLILY